MGMIIIAIVTHQWLWESNEKMSMKALCKQCYVPILIIIRTSMPPMLYVLITFIAISLTLGWQGSRLWDKDLGASGLFGWWSQEALIGEHRGTEAGKGKKSICVLLPSYWSAVMIRTSGRQHRIQLSGEEAEVFLHQFPSVLGGGVLSGY